MMFWTVLAALAAAVFVPYLLLALPARTTLLIDTSASVARADVRPLWGLLPPFHFRALPRSGAGGPHALFNEPARIGHALMTPGLADAAYEALRRAFQYRPRTAQLSLGLNLGDQAQNLVVQTAAQAALAVAPAAIRESVTLSKCEAPGAEIVARFDLTAPPLRLWSIWRQLNNSRPAREFKRRLRRKPKPVKKPVREVRTN
jgi:hypothetical protein